MPNKVNSPSMEKYIFRNVIYWQNIQFCLMEIWISFVNISFNILSLKITCINQKVDEVKETYIKTLIYINMWIWKGQFHCVFKMKDMLLWSVWRFIIICIVLFTKFAQIKDTMFFLKWWIKFDLNKYKFSIVLFWWAKNAHITMFLHFWFFD